VGEYLDHQEEFLNDVLTFFDLLRAPNRGLQKKPATAELLGWIIALKEMYKNLPNPMRHNPDLESSLSVLIKNADDFKQAKNILKEWLTKK
jgi:uncharacterized protein HemY